MRQNSTNTLAFSLEANNVLLTAQNMPLIAVIGWLLKNNSCVTLSYFLQGEMCIEALKTGLILLLEQCVRMLSVGVSCSKSMFSYEIRDYTEDPVSVKTIADTDRIELSMERWSMHQNMHLPILALPFEVQTTITKQQWSATACGTKKN